MSIPVLATGMLFSCQNDMDMVQALTEENANSIQTTYNATYNYTEDGKLKNKLVVTQLDRYLGEDPRIEVTNGFKMFIYDSLEHVEAELTANRGIYREEEFIMEAREDVVLTNRDGETLNTEELIWLQDSGIIYTDKFVKISRNDGVLFGQGMTSNETFTKYRIKNPTGEMSVSLDSLGKK